MKRQLKKQVRKALQSARYKKNLEKVESENHLHLINILFSFLCSDELPLKWHAVEALGIKTAELAERDMEKARIIMRRLIWTLTDESGGTPWGAPEAMAEIMVRQETMAKEYAGILVSYIREDGNYLEFEPLQRGAVWGVGRLAEKRKELMLRERAGEYLMPALESNDSVICGLAAYATGALQWSPAERRLKEMAEDGNEIIVYLHNQLQTCRVGELARQALEKISSKGR